jgi:orotate phosphoribosyltransferase
VTISPLIDHLRQHSLRTDGPYRLRSGATSAWYLDARQTTFSGSGARLVGAAVLDVLQPGVEVVGGMTMGADPIALATVIAAADSGRSIRAFSIRKDAKDHGIGGRLVGPVGPGDRAAVLDDTVTTGGAMFEAIDTLTAAGIEVVQAVSLVDRSDGEVEREADRRRLLYTALISPADLGVA